MSRYKIEKLPKPCIGFSVWFKDTNTKAIVSYEPASNLIMVQEENAKSSHYCSRYYNIFNYYKICSGLLHCLVYNFKFKATKEMAKNKLREWLSNKLGLRLGKRLHAEWRDILGQIEPRKLMIAKQFFRAGMSSSNVLETTGESTFWQSDLSKDAGIIYDILNYLPAAQYFRAHINIRNNLILDDGLSDKQSDEEITPILKVGYQSWQSFYLGDNQSNYALETLYGINFPMNTYMLQNLRHIDFVKPLRSKGEILIASGDRDWGFEKQRIKTDRDELKASFIEFNKYTEKHEKQHKLSLRKTSDILSFGDRIFDTHRPYIPTNKGANVLKLTENLIKRLKKSV